MEYVQTVLVQIEAARIDEALLPRGLLAELDDHRSYLERQPGFHDMRVTRSINAEGNVLLVVETRWADDHSLVEYETHEPNVVGIINQYDDLVIRDSLQVLDMEALRTEAAHVVPEAEAAERLVLPLAIPVGALAFALLVVYGLSRVYLEIPNAAATGLAAGIAGAILLSAWYIASKPSVPGWQLASIGVIAAATLFGAALFAVVHEDGEATGGEPTPAASPTPGDGGTPGTLALQLGDNFFMFEGQQGPAIPVTAGEEVTIELTNSGAATHNMHVDGTDDQYADPICASGGAAPCSDPNTIPGGGTGTITFTLDTPGTYHFRCDFHPVEMKGTLVVQ